MKLGILVVLVACLPGCMSVKTKSKLPGELKGDYVTLIEMFVVAQARGPDALALPDREFWGTKFFAGAPSEQEWRANPERYPHVVDFIPSGASLKFSHAVRESGFSLWFGFGSWQAVIAEVEGYPHALNADDLFLSSCDGDRTLNEKFTRKK